MVVGDGGGASGGLQESIQCTLQVVRGRFFVLFSSFFIMSCVGVTYMFGIYSKEIKNSLGYDQTTLNLLAFFKDLGSTVGVFAGVLTEIAPAWLVLLIGASMNFTGYFMLWLSVSARVPSPRVWQMCLYIFVGANSLSFSSTSVLITCLKNFPENLGMIVGLLKGFIGLSGAVITQLYLAIYGNNPKSLILLIALFPTVITIIFLFTIRPMKVGPQPKRVYYNYLFISFALAIFMMVITIAQKLKTFSHVGYVSGATVVCILLFLPLGITIKEELLVLSSRKKEALESVTVESSTPEIVHPIRPPTTPPVLEDKPNDVSYGCSLIKTPERGENYTILQAFLSIDMLLMLIATLTGQGSCLTAVDNFGQIGESLGYPSLTISTFISLVSIWNFFGRVLTGFISEILLSKWGFPRTLVISISLVFICIGNLIIAFPFPGSLYIASVFIGFFYGSLVTLFNTILSELFGLKRYAIIYNLGLLVIPLGSFIFNVRVAGKLYDKEALKQLKLNGLSRGSAVELTCIGKQCYRLSFIIMAIASFVGLISSLILVMRTREFYRGDIYKIFREQTNIKIERKENEIVPATEDNQPAH